MKAVLYVGDGAVRVERVGEPEVVDPTDAVVRVRRAAVCGTDLHVVAHAEHVPRGTVLGHEFVGEVTGVGADVRVHRPGALVVGADYTACGSCWWCRPAGWPACPWRR